MSYSTKSKRTFSEKVFIIMGALVLFIFEILFLSDFLQKLVKNVLNWAEKTKWVDYITPILTIVFIVIILLILPDLYENLKKYRTLGNIGIVLVLLGTLYIAMSTEATRNLDKMWINCGVEEKCGFLFLRYPEYLIIGVISIFLGSLFQFKRK